MIKIVGITGPSGSGKSLLCKYMTQSNIPCIDADALYHSMLTPKSPTVEAIAKVFGEGILSPDGSLDRASLSRCVFNSTEQLELLNATVLPLVISEIEHIISALSKQGHKAVAVDAPTLIESGFYKKCHLIVAVIAPVTSRTERIESRDHISKALAKQRITAQKNDDFYTSLADITIINDSDEDTFSKSAEKLIQKIKNL